MTTAQVVETSVTVNNNSPIEDYVHPDDQTQPTFEMTPGFKPFTKTCIGQRLIGFCVYVSVVLRRFALVTFLFICSKLYFEFLQASSD